MANPQTSESGTESPGYYPEDKSIPMTDRDFFVLENKRDVGTQIAVGEFISQERTRDASTQTPEEDLGVLGQPSATSESSEERSKKKLSNGGEQEMTHGSDVCKLPTCGTSDRLVSSFGEKRCTLFESINEEFSNSEETYSRNQELNVPGCLRNTENLKEEENVASCENIPQKEKASSEKSNTDVTKVTNVCSDDGMLAEQGPSRCHETNSFSKEFVENPKNVSHPSQQPPVKTKQKEPICLTCKKTISEHVERYIGKDMYRCCHRCCRCMFISYNFNCLQLHIYNEHTQPYYCDVCQLNYSELSCHARGGKCDVCKQNFDCKYQLEEHYILVHKDFYETHCRICKRDYEEHSIFSNKVLYQCCFKECTIRFTSTSSFDQHLRKHSRLKLIKCAVCGYYFKRPFRF